MNERDIRQHLDAIASIDDDVAAAINAYGYPQPRIRPQGFETLLAVIVGQQISTQAANSILNRVRDLLPDMSAAQLLKLAPGELRAAGLSARKVEYAEGLAQAIVEQRFDPQQLLDMDDKQAIAAISALRGFGVWSAQIYLMFSLQRADIFAQDDLALQVALQKLKKLQHRPTAKQAQKMTEHWSPWRSSGCLFLWHYYRGAPT
jgi:DNA-3-methyladenine glycosylase II